MTVIEQEAAWTDDRPTAPSTPSEPVASARQHRFLSRAAWREFALLGVVYELYTATSPDQHRRCRRSDRQSAPPAAPGASCRVDARALATTTYIARPPTGTPPGPFAHINPVTENVSPL